MNQQSLFSKFIHRLVTAIEQILTLETSLIFETELFEDNWRQNNPNPSRRDIHNYRAEYGELVKPGTASEAFTKLFQFLAFIMIPFSLLGLMVYFWSPFFFFSRRKLVLVTLFFAVLIIIVSWFFKFLKLSILKWACTAKYSFNSLILLRFYQNYLNPWTALFLMWSILILLALCLFYYNSIINIYLHLESMDYLIFNKFVVEPSLNFKVLIIITYLSLELFSLLGILPLFKYRKLDVVLRRFNFYIIVFLVIGYWLSHQFEFSGNSTIFFVFANVHFFIMVSYLAIINYFSLAGLILAQGNRNAKIAHIEKKYDGSTATQKGIWVVNSNGTQIFITENFIQWFTGFTDAEGNFHLSLKYLDKIAQTYKSHQLTFQIALHIDDLQTLIFIQNQLGCGSIMKDSKNPKANFAISKLEDLKLVILPIFVRSQYFGLRSSKVHSFNLFNEVVSFVDRGQHLTAKGKLQMIAYKNQFAKLFDQPQSSLPGKLTPYWLLGFTEGDACFSTSGLSTARCKYENIIFESSLFEEIKLFLGVTTTIQYPSERDRNKNETKVVVLDITKIEYLYLVIIPLFANLKWQSKKQLDFADWSIIVKLLYFGYHLYPEGIELLKMLKSRMNNFRLSSNPKGFYVEIPQELIDSVFALPVFYEAYGVLRVKVNTDTVVTKIKVIEVYGPNSLLIDNFTKFADCAKFAATLKISKTDILNGLKFNFNKSHVKGYTFVFKI